MLINGISLSTLGVQLYDRILTSNKVVSTKTWLEGDIQPTYIRQQDKFKSMILKFLITEQNEETAFVIMSKLTAMLRKATIIFDDMALSFDVTLEGETSQDRLKNGNFILTVKLSSDYAKGQTEIYTTDASATNYFYLNVLYYQNNSKLIQTDKVLIKSVQFNDANITLEKLGIDVNKYQPDYYNPGVVSNFSNRELTYDNLRALGTLIINYTPTVYYKDVEYFLGNENGVYTSITVITLNFTKEEVDSATNIGQIVNLNANKPQGYRARINFNETLTFENLMNFSALQVYFDKIENEQTKTITVNYYKQNDDSEYVLITSQLVNVKEGNIVDGTTLADVININGYKPEKYYNDGICTTADYSNLVTFESLKDSYDIQYALTDNNILVEYYYGEYPNWVRITTNLYKIKYNTSFDSAEDIFSVLKIDYNKYLNDRYETAKIYNKTLFSDFDSVINAGVVQVYYPAKEYTIRVSYVKDETALGYKDVIINDLMFMGSPALGEIIDINAMRPEGYIFSAALSYSGEVTLSALTAASPIVITYIPVEQIKTKSVVIRYKQELSSTYSTLNTSIITIEESAVGGGIKLSSLIDLNAYKPDYYDNGILDGYSADSLLMFDEIQGSYDVLYLASTYSTPVHYYTDEVSNYNWVGSEVLNYRVIDFTTETTLIDLGLNVNAFKPSYCEDGIVDYTGAVTFNSLVNLAAINVTYKTVSEPEDPDGISYPHRILFLQHNDMGDYESEFSNWTLNHAYINTGVTVADMSKLAVSCSTVRVFETEPLYNVNVGDAYLFGSITPQGGYYIKYVNNTKYKSGTLSGINTFNVCAGMGTPELVVEETASEGFSRNTGIATSDRAGYSYATLTYTNLVQSNAAPMNVPLYLFACNMNGYYKGGIAGVGITGCKIYYEDVLIRDFVPVQFFDKIGDKVAPSNCLYDKVTQTFFEDARKKDSFNIMDDPKYPEVKPEHKIGCCYVNYYKDDTLFNTATIWFRGDEFINGNYDPYEKFFVDYYQPQYCGAGTITNLADIGGITFDNLKNKVINVQYKSTGYNCIVNYYRDSVSAENLIASDTIALVESDFYQAPTFGDIIPLLKYKPANYKVNYEYPESKVTLMRIMAHSPYSIVYTKVDEPKLYTTTMKFYKKIFGVDVLHPLNTYKLVGTKDITIDETQFAEGIYVEDYLKDSYNAFIPNTETQVFYKAGQPYEWYEKDEMLKEPADLKSEYLISYEPQELFIDINYYTDEVDEENLIASTTWEVKVSDWTEDAEFQIVDELPNTYIDKYKPAICGGGRLDNPSKVYTFASLVAQGSLNIIYDTLSEPHDPDNTMFPKKVLWFDRSATFVAPDGSDSTIGIDKLEADGAQERSCFCKTNPPGMTGGGLSSINITTPYFDLGYTPKEIGRLRIETKAYALNTSLDMEGNITPYGMQDKSYSYFLGYYGAVDFIKYGQEQGSTQNRVNILSVGAANKAGSGKYTNQSPYSSGWLAFRGHTVKGSGLVYTHPTPQFYDGHSTYNISTGEWIDGFDDETVREMSGGFRKGTYSELDDNLNPITIFDNYSKTVISGYKKTHSDYIHPTYVPDYEWRTGYDKDKDFLNYDSKQGTDGVWIERKFLAVGFNPITMTIDAYNNYIETYDYRNSKNPDYINIDNHDHDLFKYRCKPKAPITLFITTNPDTGRLNWKPTSQLCYLNSNIANTPGAFFPNNIGNPWSPDFNPKFSYTQQVVTGKNDDGTPIYENKVFTKNIEYASYSVDVSPTVQRAFVYYIKVWDRDKLVRDLIPVAAGDKIYDYIAPANCLFDKVTESFFINQNKGGTYSFPTYHGGKFSGIVTKEVSPEQVRSVYVSHDPTYWGSIVVNYYNENNEFINNQYVEIPVHYKEANETIYDICHYNDFKPNDFYHDGMIDIDLDLKNPSDDTLKAIFNAGSINVYYKLITFTKTVVYYRGDTRVGSKDLFYSIADIKNAKTLADLGIDVNLYANEDFKPGRIVFNEQVIADDDIKAFIDASSPIVVYDKYTKEERPDLFYTEYFRSGAYDSTLITPNADDANYLDCDLDAVVLNPYGAVKYLNHYHQALYEDEKQDYFIAYQVDVVANYVTVYKGPARRYSALATIVDKGRYTVLEEKNGFGRLKEYPKGWILLSYTKSVVGPGQNPDFTKPDESVYKIPFASRITINKLTVDRLWAYCPEYASWIKAEDISYNQSGRLYNGLHIDSIHLDTIDWSKITSLKDLGINPEAYKLKYHDNCGYSYEGDFTQAAFANIHSLEFVYPETIYHYNCIYYKDTKAAGNEIGREAFSCSMSDWNPDWDKFIETSWQVKTEDLSTGDIKVRNESVDVYEKPSLTSKKLLTMVPKMSAQLTGELVENEDNSWYPIRYIGNTHPNATLGYVLASKVDVTTPYQENIKIYDINPTVYRDTPLTLTWDYFGFERNAHKPETGNYEDGMYLWNPRSFENDDIRFTFEELVTVGSQAVLYVHTLPNFKMVGNVRLDALTGFTTIPGASNTVSGSYDIEVKSALGCNDDGPAKFKFPYQYRQSVITTYGTQVEMKSSPAAKNIPAQTEYDYIITNISNKRNASIVYAYGKDLTGYQSPFYAINQGGGDGTATVSQPDEKITYELNLTTKNYNLFRPFVWQAEKFKNYNFFWNSMLSDGKLGYDEEYPYYKNAFRQSDLQYQYLGYDGSTIYTNPEFSAYYWEDNKWKSIRVAPSRYPIDPKETSNYSYPMIAQGNKNYPFFYLKVWQNYNLIHYYVPVARGTWLEDGRQIQNNTLYDIITNTILEGNEDIKVYHTGTLIQDETEYSPFDAWTFETTECNQPIKASKATIGYKYPDVLAKKLAEYEENTVMPAFKYTEDAKNHVSGKWYYNGYAWVQGSDVTMITDETYTISEKRDTVALKGDELETAVTYKAYYAPSTNSNSKITSFTTETLTDIKAVCSSWYWNGLYWIPVSYTSDYTTEDNTLYVVASDYIAVYSYPLEKDAYRINRIQSGDRITSVKLLTKNNDWKYINKLGWIRASDALEPVK